MKKALLISFSLFFAGFSFSQNKTAQVSHDVIYPTEFHLTKPLSEIVKEHPVDPNFNYGERESEDRNHRPPQTFLYTTADGPQYGNDSNTMQIVMGTKQIPQTKAILQNWAGQVATGFRPMDPTGSVSSNYYIQMINSTTFKIFNKTNGANVLTSTLGNLWSPATANAGDPIVMYDKYADRWFLSQFGSSNEIFIAISQTNDPTGAYYTYTYTSPQFPDYLKFSIWENGYYMTSNQTTDKVFCFERDQMIIGNPSARAISANFTTGSVSAFFCPLPADASDGGLPSVGTPLPFFAYYDNAWGGGTDGVKIWNMTVTWGGTPAASITTSTLVTTSAFDASYNASWNDVSQPGTAQKLDGIGGVPTYRAQWRPWAGYNSLVLNWGVYLSASQRSIRWVELRQNQSTGVWSLYQEGTYTPDVHTRWMGSIAMDNNGSIALAYAKSSTTIYPSLCYTGRLASDPLGTMSFAETIAIAGTSSQTTTNRYGDYAHTALDPDGITFWHTGEYIAAGVKTRVYSFQLPVPNPIAGVAIAVTSGTNPSCAGSSVTFTATPTNGGTSPAYQWQVNGSNVGTNSTTYTTTTLTNGQIVTCIMTSNLPGVTGNPATSNSITMVINPIPSTPTASSNSPVCAGATINLTTPTVTGATYSWSGPNAFTSSTQNPTIASATTAMDGSYSVIVTQSGCNSLPGSTSVTINTGPATPTASSNSPVCVGSSINLATPTVAGATYSWTGPNGFSSSLQNPTIASATTAMAGTYTLNITLGGCPSLDGLTAVVINSIPVADFTASPTTTNCSGFVQFTDISTGNPTSWSWDFGDTQTSTTQSPSNSYLASGTYSVTLTAANSCGNNQKVQPNYITINVPTAPTGVDGLRCGTGTVNLSASGGSGILHWFDAPSAGTDLGTGATFTTPSISTTTSYYVEDHIVQPSQYVGPLTNFAAGSYSNTLYTLNFNCLVPCTLVSVAVGKQVAGNVLIQLTDAVGTVLSSGTFAISAGASRVTLNWPLTVATGLKLVGQTGVGLWRVNTPGTFPYTLAGLVSITSCSSGTRFGSYFDWEIKESDCVSTRIPVTATVTPAVTPSVAIVADNSTICTGTSVTFTATPTNGGTPIYQWQLNGANVGAGGATYSNGTLANSDIVTCVMTTSVSCATSPTATSNAITMTVSLPLTPSVAIVADNSTICTGTSVTFTATPTNGGTPLYQWQLNGANVGINSSTYSNGTLANGDIVTCVMTTSESCATSPTVTSNAVTMTVNTSVTPSVAIVADNSTICTGTSVTFTATPTNGGTPIYQWKLNGANVGANSSTYSNGTLANGDIVTCVMTTSVSCATSPTATSNAVTMTVNITPNVYAGADQMVCEGTSIILSASGASSYYWNNGVTDGVPFTPSAGVFVYTVTGITNGCSNTDQVIFTVNSTPIVNAGFDQSVCEGSSVTLSGSGATTYSWDNGVSNGVPFYPTLGSLTYTVTGSSNGCSATDQVVVTVNTVPTVYAGADQTVCEGTSVTLAGSGADTYYWNNGVVDGSPFIPLLGVNIYNVTGILNGCSNTDQVIVTVNFSPVVNAGVDQTVCIGTSVTLSGSGATSYIWNNGITNGTPFTPSLGSLTYTLTGTSNGCSATDQVIVTVNAVDNYSVSVSGPVATVTTLPLATYQWFDCDNGNANIIGETNSSYTASVNGNYGVIINQNGCTSTSSCVFIDITIIGNNATYPEINIYPNPTNGILNIYFGQDLKNVNIVMEDIIGQNVLEIKENQAKGTLKSIDLTKFAKGIYFININNKDISLKYKVLYQK